MKTSSKIQPWDICTALAQSIKIHLSRKQRENSILTSKVALQITLQVSKAFFFLSEYQKSLGRIRTSGHICTNFSLKEKQINRGERLLGCKEFDIKASKQTNMKFCPTPQR